MSWLGAELVCCIFVNATFDDETVHLLGRPFNSLSRVHGGAYIAAEPSAPNEFEFVPGHACPWPDCVRMITANR